MALACGGLLFVCSAQPLIQLEGLLVHQRAAEHTVEMHHHLQQSDLGCNPQVHRPLPGLIPALAFALRSEASSWFQVCRLEVQVLPQGRQPVASPALLNRCQKD